MQKLHTFTKKLIITNLKSNLCGEIKKTQKYIGYSALSKLLIKYRHLHSNHLLTKPH